MKNSYFYFLLTLISLIGNVYADEIIKNNSILEKRVNISSARKCDTNKDDAEYKCICDLSISYPLFIKQSSTNGLQTINAFIEDFIKGQRNKMSNCQVGGIDFGINTLNYNILYEDDQYLSLAFEKYFCCNVDGAKPDLVIFNFDKISGQPLSIDKYIPIDNVPQLANVIDNALNKQLNKPDGYKNMLLQVYKTDAGLSQVKLRNFVFFYFTQYGITLKVWPDKNSFETISIPLPNNLINQRSYLTAMPQDDQLNDSLMKNILLKDDEDTE